MIFSEVEFSRKTEKIKSVRAKTKQMLFDEKLEGFAEILKKNHPFGAKLRILEQLHIPSFFLLSHGRGKIEILYKNSYRCV